MNSPGKFSMFALVLALAATAAPWSRAGGNTAPNATSVAAGQAGVATDRDWHRTVVDADSDLRLRAAVADGDGGLWALYTRREKGRPLDEGDLHLMRLDAAGNRSADDAVTLPAALASRPRGHAVALALGDDRHPAVLSTTDTGIALIEPAIRTVRQARVRHLATDAWPLALQAAGPGQFRIVTNEAVMLWPGTGDPRVELPAGASRVFAAASPAPGRGFALLRAQVTPHGFDSIEVGRQSGDSEEAAVFGGVDDVAAAGVPRARLAASGSSLLLLSPVEKGPPSRWRHAVFDRDMNLLHAGLVSLPFELSVVTPLAALPLAAGGTLLASAREGRIWLARVDERGALRERDVPAHVASRTPQDRSLSDMAWVPSGGADRAMLVATVLVADEEQGRTDYGLWFASINLHGL